MNFLILFYHFNQSVKMLKHNKSIFNSIFISFLAMLAMQVSYPQTSAVQMKLSDYCNLTTCKVNVTHVACANTGGNWSASCPSDHAFVPLHQAEINKILDMHNSIRSALAMGQVNGLAKAAKMPKLVSRL